MRKLKEPQGISYSEQSNSGALNHQKSSTGFTLIEMLVVMAILAVLVTILSPTFSGGLEAAESVTCKSNLKQQGVAMKLFATDHDGRLPYHRDMELSQSGYGMNWADHVADYVGYDVLECPSRTEWEDPFDPEAKIPINLIRSDGTPDPWEIAHRMPYGYNAYWLGLGSHRPGLESHPSGRNYTLLADCREASKVLMLADSRLATFHGWSSTLWFPKRNTVHFEGIGSPHGNGQMGNVVFVDGHVESLNAEKVNNMFDMELLYMWLPDPVGWPNPDHFGGDPQ